MSHSSKLLQGLLKRVIEAINHALSVAGALIPALIPELEMQDACMHSTLFSLSISRAVMSQTGNRQDVTSTCCCCVYMAHERFVLT